MSAADEGEVGMRRRTFLHSTLGVLASATVSRAVAADDKPLFAYVGTFSSPLKDVLPTQVDRPPGNGRGIHVFRVDRETGTMTASGVHELGTSPSCVAIDAARLRLYSANETDQVGAKKEGTVSSFAIDPMSGGLKALDTVTSGG